ncbi:MAG: carboxypeptidase-like regulatory domain-containing protein [Aigarchaeota archaeon]|nr:carboxypeptidase-like regulatory domain-containing protein [Aigarchaeota archaeon]
MIKVQPNASEYERIGLGDYVGKNVTIKMDGSIGLPGSPFDFTENGPVVLWKSTSVGDFAAIYNKPEKAFVTQCAVIWMKFHTHTWYSLLDNLSYAQVRVYDLNYTAHGVSATSEATLVGAAVTLGKDGLSAWVPIPLQTHHLKGKVPFSSELFEGSNARPHLNATARVWWETVLVNQTKFIEENQLDYENFDSTTLDLNCTVFYARFGAIDLDPRVEHPTVGDALVDAQVVISLTRQKAGETSPTVYFDMKDLIALTGIDGYTVSVSGPAMLGALKEFKEGGFMRFPNASIEGATVYNPADARNRAEALAVPCERIVNIKELNTVSLDDDRNRWGEFEGIVVQVKWGGGPANAYSGAPVTVNSTYIANPYYVALKSGGWVTPSVTPNDERLYVEDEFVAIDDIDDLTFDVDGLLTLECTVYDLMIQIVDQLGSPLEPLYTKVVLTRPNGPPVEFTDYPNVKKIGDLPVTYHTWITANGTLFIYQLPGEIGPYGVKVYYQGVLVYENLTLIGKLVRTENLSLVTSVYKLLVKVTDAHDEGLAYTPVKYVHPTYGDVQANTADEGIIPLPKVPVPAGAAPTLVIKSVYWKGVWVTFLEKDAIKYPDGTTANAQPDGSVAINITKAAAVPIIVRAKITDIIFYTYDFQKVEKIPNVNITMCWWGLNITTGKMVKFVETMDGNVGKPWEVAFDQQPYNTSKIVAQFFRYRITYYADEGKTIFHQMPALDEDVNKPCINVTTTVKGWKWDGTQYVEDPFDVDLMTPGSQLWGGDEYHGRTVLRVLPKALNPDVYYPDIIGALNFKDLTFCRRVSIDLPLWAMGFDVVAINGERWLGDAEFAIYNDMGTMMDIVKTNATAPIKLRSKVDYDNLPFSKIWWNSSTPWVRDGVGSGYYCADLTFETDMGVTVDMFTWYRPGGEWPLNIAPRPDFVAANYTFYLTPDVDLKDKWATRTSTVEVYVGVDKTEPVKTTYYIPYVYDKELLKVPLPVGIITLELKDQGGVRPLKYAYVEIKTYRTYETIIEEYEDCKWVGKVDAAGKAEIIAPTAGYLNYTLKKENMGLFKTFDITVYWYLNSSIVYKAYFNLTKMGWKVDKVAVSDVVLYHAVCADFNRVVKGLYADLAWINVTMPDKYVHPGRLVVNDTAKTWRLVPVDEAMGKKAWSDGKLELNLVPTAMKFKVYDYFLNKYVEWNVSHLWRVAAWYTGLEKGPVKVDGKSYKQLMFGSGTDDSPVKSAVWVIIGADPFDHTTYAWRRDSGDVISGYNDTLPTVDRYTPDVEDEIKLVKYLEPAKTKEVIEATRTVKHVALKLNATDIAVRVVWQEGENATATYTTGPLVGWRVSLTFVPPAEYLTDAEREALWAKWKRTFSGTTDETGTAWIRSGDTPETVIWNASRIKAGMTKEASWLVVSPPAYMLNEKDPYWLRAEAHGLTVFEGAQDPAAMVGIDLTPEGYFSWLPDPSLWVSDPSDFGYSRIYNLYGRPVEMIVQNEWGAGLWLPSKFGEGLEGSSGWARIGGAWYARINVWPNDPKTSQHVPFTPVFQYMPVTAKITDFNGRPLPGAFFWMVDSVTGKTAGWSYAGKDGVTETVYLRKPEWTLLLRVHYLGRGADGSPAWPFNAFGKWPVSYYSDADETEPGPGIFGELAKRVKVTTLAHQYHGVWRIRPGAHWDIMAKIFDIRVRHYYAEAKPIEVDATFYREFPDKTGGTVEFKAKEVIEVKRLNRGTYDEIAKWLGVVVGRKSFDLSAANVGTVAGELQVAVGEISVAAKDITGRVLSDAVAKFEGVEQKLTIPSEILAKYKLASEDDAKTLKAVGAVFVTKLPVPTNIRYSLDLSWTSPTFGTEAKVSIVDTVDGINARREIILPVGVVTVNVVDGKGSPVAGAEVSLGAVKAKTDAAGKAVFESVPLEREGKGISYQIVVVREGEEVYRTTETFSTAKTSITVIGQLFDLSVSVKGAAGQGLPFATVTLKRAGVVVGHFTTDEGGSVTIPKLVAADYEVEASYKGYTGTAKVSKADLMAGKMAEITLPPYIEIAGMPMTFATFVALIIGIILLVIVVVVIAFEYVRWRGRRVGIFPPPPPKK